MFDTPTTVAADECVPAAVPPDRPRSIVNVFAPVLTYKRITSVSINTSWFSPNFEPSTRTRLDAVALMAPFRVDAAYPSILAHSPEYDLTVIGLAALPVKLLTNLPV